jgi:exodeoxyribonuclease V alpha subunit
MELPCIVSKVTYRSDKFAILACNLDKYSDKYKQSLEATIKPCINKTWKTFTVVLDTLHEDENPEGGNYVFVGDIVQHKKMGEQFKASGYYQDIPTSRKAMKTFLMRLPNIKQSRAQEIMSMWSVGEIVDVLDNNPKLLLQVKGITEKRLEVIVEEWKRSSHKRDLYKWFMDCKIPIRLADRSYTIWGDSTRQKLTENPYLLTSLRSISFLNADLYAHKINPNVDENFRVISCMEYCLGEDSRYNGNLCMPYGNMKRVVVQQLVDCDAALGKVSKQNYDKLIPNIVKDPRSLFTAVKDTKSNIIYLYLTSVWEKEKFIAETLYKRSLSSSVWDCDDQDIVEAESNISFFLGREIELDDTQKQAVKSVFNNKVTVITGGGGTGKSTICRCIYFLARKHDMTVKMMSPTGKAAKVLSNRTGGTATTIHRGLGIGPGSDLPENTITQDILLVDEISMAGVDTMYALMVAIESNKDANIVFVGDKNQLPSVSPGNFLADLMETSCANIVTLDRVHRQNEDSYISLIANDISKGKSTKIPNSASDITWNDLDAHTVEKEIREFVDEYTEDNDIDDLQILSPMKKGVCGVNNINSVVQEMMAKIHNTTNKCLEREFNKFYMFDRVIQTRNNYEKDVFNGDMGTVVELGERIKDPERTDKKEKYIAVDFGGKKVYYYRDEIEEVMVAWAITIHKFQGSQSKDIVMFMASEASVMMNKELVYTGMTRAESHLYIYGHGRMYNLAPTRSSIRKRFTNLNNILEELSGKKKILRVV